jgi:hypothetical protein
MGVSTNSNYPGGFAGGVTIRNMPLLSAYPGKVFWVSSTANSAGAKGTFDRPMSTVAACMALCTAGRGDIIMVKANHAETITAAGTIACSVSGVAIIGLGTGSHRPTFTFTTANTAAITVSAANVSWVNCVFTANFLSIAAAFTLSTAKWFTVQACLFQDTSGVLNFLNCVKSTGAANTADGLTVTDSQWFGTGTTSVNAMVLIADANIDVTLLRNRCILERTADQSILIVVTTGASTNIEIGDNVVISKQTAVTNGGTLANVGATSTGVVYRNFSGTLVTTGDKLFTTTVGLFAFENRVAGVVGTTGFVIPVADS